MYILDLNVLNIIDGSHSDTNVRRWFSSIDETELYMCVLTLIEIGKNASTLGKRGKREAADKVEKTIMALKTSFAGRILSLDLQAAEDWGRMLGNHGGGDWDVGIAAIAKQHGYVVATRNVKHFLPRGAAVVDPFKHPATVVKPPS